VKRRSSFHHRSRAPVGANVRRHMLLRCGACGSNVPGDAAVCPSCGFQFGVLPASSSSQPPQSTVVGTYKVAGRRRRLCDIAYYCFVITGLFSLLAWVGDNSKEHVYLWTIFIGLWLAIPSGIALVVGIVLSLMVWRHWPLHILSLATLLVVAEVMTEAGPVVFYKVAPLAYCITCFAFALVWFARFRNATNEGEKDA